MGLGLGVPGCGIDSWEETMGVRWKWNIQEEDDQRYLEGTHQVPWPYSQKRKVKDGSGTRCDQWLTVNHGLHFCKTLR